MIVRISGLLCWSCAFSVVLEKRCCQDNAGCLARVVVTLVVVPKKSQELKPSTAAAKLGVYLPATPEEFQAKPVTRDELAALEANPPQWLTDLRRNGPHPRQVVAARLRVSTSGLARAGVTDPLTTAEIAALIAEPPEWLIRERHTFDEVRREEQRIAERDAARRAGPADQA
jgi:hypothetical protein